MPGFEYPLLKKPVEILTGYFPNTFHEVVCIDWLIGMLGKKVLEYSAEAILAQVIPQHMEDQRSFLVGMPIKVLVGVLPLVKNDRALVVVFGFIQIGLALIE